MKSTVEAILVVALLTMILAFWFGFTQAARVRGPNVWTVSPAMTAPLTRQKCFVKHPDVWMFGCLTAGSGGGGWDHLSSAPGGEFC